MADDEDPLSEATPGQKLFFAVLSFVAAGVLVVLLVLGIAYVLK